MEDFGISVILQRVVDEFFEQYPIKVSLEIDGMDDLFLQDSKITIYRILQEALSDVGRHAQAKNVSIVMKKRDDEVSLDIEDGGKGFDVKQALRKDAPRKGWG